MYGLKTESAFDAAHFLSDYDGKCENLHGHRWRVIAWIEVDELQTTNVSDLGLEPVSYTQLTLPTTERV